MKINCYLFISGDVKVFNNKVLHRLNLIVVIAEDPGPAANLPAFPPGFDKSSGRDGASQENNSNNVSQFGSVAMAI